MENLSNYLKKFKPVDVIIIAGVIIALIVGFFTYKNYYTRSVNYGKTFSNKRCFRRC